MALEALRQERAELEPHMQQDGGCRAQMWTECRICERYYDVEDRIVAAEQQEVIAS